MFRAVHVRSEWDGAGEHPCRAVGGRTPRDGVRRVGLMVPLTPPWIEAAKDLLTQLRAVGFRHFNVVPVVRLLVVPSCGLALGCSSSVEGKD